MQSSALYRSLARASVAAATIASFGAQSALGFFDTNKNQSLFLGVSSLTNITALKNTSATSSKTVVQTGVGPSNQNAVVLGGASANSSQTVVGSSSNSVTVVQQ